METGGKRGNEFVCWVMESQHPPGDVVGEGGGAALLKIWQVPSGEKVFTKGKENQDNIPGRG